MIDQSGDDHVLKFHQPLSKAPLFTDLGIEREQLPDVNEPARGRESTTHTTVRLKGCNMPLNEVRDFPDQPGLRHSIGGDIIILGGELFKNLF